MQILQVLHNTAIGRQFLCVTQQLLTIQQLVVLLLANTTGCQNTAVGANALDANTTGNFNTALGYQFTFCEYHRLF
jgi:hypothetical protein